MNNISGKTKICMVIGDPVKHSLSPKMHNLAYKALGIDDEFVFVASQVKSEDLSDFIKGVKAMNIQGIACTIPHKRGIIKYLDSVDEVAQKIGSVNTVVNSAGLLKGYNTDWLGIINPLEKITSLKSKTVALIGAGGTARAAAYGVTKKGAKLTIYNRSLKKGEKLAKEFGGEALSLQNLEKIKDADIIFNATPLGMHPNENKTPIPKELIRKNQIVFDAVYTPSETKLLRDAKSAGAQIISGTEMFIEQGATQFKLFTGKVVPVDVMKKIFLKHSQSFCLPILKEGKEEILKIIKDNIHDFEYFEVWLDYIKDLDEFFIKNLINEFKDKLIIVFRRKNLETMKLSFEKRVKIIYLLENSGSLLDLDIISQKKELSLIRKKGVKISTIVSYHNYHQTPNDRKLKEIIDTIKEYKPSILKIATKCNSSKDALQLLRLLLMVKEKNMKCIVLGMGEFGIITRIFGSLWGNELTFTPKNKFESSAPGQLTKNQLETIFGIL
ncbi:shikimate dehydrogenase [Patescibacteria group bacterium]|nr:shikimate dehydrogenase [Patescibacteria group bacterium]